jgi:hypothetical protein
MTWIRLLNWLKAGREKARKKRTIRADRGVLGRVFMKALAIISLTVAGLLLGSQAWGGETPRWEPRLFLTASGSVWSPGGNDKDRFTASLGGSASVFYWFNWNTQVMLSGSYARLNTQRYYWMPESLADSIPDVWDVKGGLWTVSLDVRRLFPADNKNYLYVGLGGSYYHFAQVKGTYQIYQTGAVQTGEVISERDPSEALGLHGGPGLFFLFYPRVSVDVTVQVHLLYDGDQVEYWLQPMFGIGYRLF